MYIDNWRLAIEKSWRVGLGHDFSADGADMMMDMAVRIFRAKSLKALIDGQEGLLSRNAAKKRKRKHNDRRQRYVYG